MKKIKTGTCEIGDNSVSVGDVFKLFLNDAEPKLQPKTRAWLLADDVGKKIERSLRFGIGPIVPFKQRRKTKLRKG